MIKMENNNCIDYEFINTFRKENCHFNMIQHRNLIFWRFTSKYIMEYRTKNPQSDHMQQMNETCRAWLYYQSLNHYKNYT